MRYEDRTELASYCSKRTKCEVLFVKVSGGGICEEADMTGTATATRFGVFYLISTCPVLKGLSYEIHLTEIGVNRYVCFKGRAPRF
jgi:hypothetical protein